MFLFSQFFSLQRILAAEAQLDFLQRQPISHEQFTSVSVSNSMPLQVRFSDLSVCDSATSYHSKYISTTSFLQMNKLHGSEHLLYNCCSDSDYDTNLVAADRSSCDQNDTCEKLSKAASNECSWLELDGLVSLSPPPVSIKRKEELSPRLSISSSDAFEVELRQHLFDVLHHIDDLERQVM